MSIPQQQPPNVTVPGVQKTFQKIMAKHVEPPVLEEEEVEVQQKTVNLPVQMLVSMVLLLLGTMIASFGVGALFGWAAGVTTLGGAIAFIGFQIGKD